MFTKFEYSMITLLGFCALLVSSLLYNWFLKSVEERWLLSGAMIVNCLGSAMTLLYVLEITFGLPPLIFVALTSTVSDTIFLAMNCLPSMVLFAKLIPSQIESSMFAVLMGLLNLSTTVLSKLIGNFYNEFIGVTNSNLDDIWKLYVISTALAILPLSLVWLLPSKAQVGAVQRIYEYNDLKQSGRQSECDIQKLDPVVAKRCGVVIEYPSPPASESPMLHPDDCSKKDDVVMEHCSAFDEAKAF